jgi:multiple sugar transport system substrate-binding protein
MMANFYNQTRRVRVLAAGLVLLCFSLSSACVSSCGKGPDNGKATITVALFKSPAVDAAVPLIPEFEKQSGIKVQFEVLPYSELQDKVQTEFLARSPRYDAVMADCIWIPKFASEGYLRSVDDYLKSAELTPSDYDPADLIPSVADYLGKYPANGTTYGFPFMTNSHVLAYRRDLYEKVLRPQGIRQPGSTLGDAWTWEEYLRAAKLLTTKDQSIPGGTQWGSSMQARAGAWVVYEWYSWLYGAGGRDIDYATMKPNFTSKESIEGIRRYASMVNSVAPRSVLSWGHEEETQALGSGLCVMDATNNVELIGYLVDPTKSAYARDLAFAVSPLGANGKPTPDMGGYGLLLSAFSRHPRETYQFLVWLTSPAVHRRIVLSGGTPFRYSEMKDAEILAKYPVYSIYGIALENSVFRARVPEWPEIEDIISKELTKALTGEASPEQAASAMQDKVGAILQRSMAGR